jgi:alpha-L-fucosidase 2
MLIHTKKLAIGRFLLFIALFFSLSAAAQNPRSDFFAKQDLTWDSLPAKWEQGAFIGNGLLGAMVYKASDSALQFVLSRTDVTDHREGINPSLGKARLPIGRFVLEAGDRITGFSMRLDLLKAELRGTIRTARKNIPFEAIAIAGRDIIVLRYHQDISRGIPKPLLHWEAELSQSPFRTIGRDTSAAYKPNPMLELQAGKGTLYQYQPMLAGGSYTTAFHPIVSQLVQTMVITIANSYPADDSKQRAIDTVAAVKAEDIPKMIAAHRAWWRSFYAKSAIYIPDGRLQSFWYIQQYKMASATRVGARPIDLMGPWYYVTPWPKYWWNLNAQLTYYPFFSSNHADLAQPLVKMIDDHIENLSNNAPEPYRHNSAALGRSGPYDMTGGIKVVKGNDSARQSSASLELGNLGWLLHVYYQAYEYTKNKEVQHSIYLVLTRAVNYYRHILTKEPDGKYHLPYTYSPEYPKGITRDANYDLAVLRWAAKTLLQINNDLSLKDSLEPAWKDIVAHLAPYPEDALGYRIGRDADFSISHRHYSHLLMIYPFGEITPANNEAVIRRSLNTWKSRSEAWRGYSYTGAGSIHALLGEGDSTWKMLNEMMKGRFSIKPNTMYLEAGPVIETPLSAVTTINEMLLQSVDGTLRIFPALPASWKDAAFDKLLAKGGFEVSAERRNGATVSIRIKSIAGGRCVVATGMPADRVITSRRAIKFAHRKDGLVEMDLVKGDEVLIYTGKKRSSFVINPVATDVSNYWGLKK